MRLTLVLVSLCAVLAGCTLYIIFLVTAGAGTSHASAAAQPAPTLTSQQLAAIAAINTLLLSDDEEPETLVLLYVNGDNNLAVEMQKHKLLQKIHEGAGNPEITVRMVLDWPGLGNSRYYQVDQLGATNCDFLNDFTCGGRYRDGQNVRIFPEDLGDPANLSQFIQDAIAENPQTKRIILAMIGHGGGWSPNLLAGQPQHHGGKPGTGDAELGGLLWDDYTGNGPGNSLSTLDLHQALSDAKSKTGRTIDLLYLDACLMGMAEVAYEVRDEVTYLLTSESWSWTSFAYDAHLAAITNAQPTEAIGKAWISNEVAVLQPYQYAYTYALLDLTQTTTLTTSIDAFAQLLEPLVEPQVGKDKVQTAFAQSDCFDSNGDALIDRKAPAKGKGMDNYCDLASFVGQIQQQFSTTVDVVNAVEAVQLAISNTVRSEVSASGIPSRYSTIPWQWGQLGGISIYTPLGQDDWKRGLYTQLQFATNTHWDEFLSQYWNQASPPANTECPFNSCPLPNGPLSINYTLYLPVVRR